MTKEQFKNLKIGDKIYFKFWINEEPIQATIIKYNKTQNEYIAIEKEYNIKRFINKYNCWRFEI